MKRLLFLTLAILLISPGCLPGLPSPSVLPGLAPLNEPPTAFIDSISPSRPLPGQRVVLTGHGAERDGEVVGYEWRSSIDGVLGTAATLQVPSLSVGTHVISFRVRDDKGKWSADASMNIVVLPSGAIKPPVVVAFEAAPASIFEKGRSALNWNVSGATSVRISPDIGLVSLQGSRVVEPARSTTYILTATNDGGDVTAEARVMVIPAGVYKVELFAAPAESGHVRRSGEIGIEPDVGEASGDIPLQAFLSFDISTIPAGARVRSASLEIGVENDVGDPFSFLGTLGVFNQQYGVLNSSDFAEPPQARISRYIPVEDRYPMTDAIYTFAGLPYSSALVIEASKATALVGAVQNQVDAGSKRFQLRLQFEKYIYYNYANTTPNYLIVSAGKSKLFVEYEGR